MDIVTLLRNQAQEIAEEGHDSWKNTMVFAADEIETLRRHKKELAAQLEAAQQSQALDKVPVRLGDACPTCGGCDVQCAECLNVYVEKMEAALEAISAWCDAYPLTVFPEPDMNKARELLNAGGVSLDAISAHNMRHVINGISRIVREGLGEE